MVRKLRFNPVIRGHLYIHTLYGTLGKRGYKGLAKKTIHSQLLKYLKYFISKMGKLNFEHLSEILLTKFVQNFNGFGRRGPQGQTEFWRECYSSAYLEEVR